MKKMLPVVIALLLLSSPAYSQWLNLSTGLDYTFSWNSLSFLNANVGYLAGFNSLDQSCKVLKTMDGGTTWTDVTPSNTAICADVHFVNEDTGWICGGIIVAQGQGSNQFIKKTADGGATWTDVTPSPVPANGVSQVWFVDESLGWAVTYEDIGGGNHLFSTDDGGANWTGAKGPGPLRYQTLFVIDDNTILAAGETATGGALVGSVDGGSTWGVVKDFAIIQPGVGIFGLFARSLTNIWAVGTQGARFLTTDGTNWNLTQINPEAADRLCDIVFIDDNLGITVGRGDPEPGVQQWRGIIMTTTDGGQTWNNDVIAPTVLSAISAAGGNAYVCGAANLVYKYEGFYQTSVQESKPSVPQDFELYNYPNPFNPSTTIHISLEKSSTVTLTVYDILGNVVKILHNGKLAAGSHKIQWEGTNLNRQEVASGVYFYRLETATGIFVNKMLLVR